MKVITKQKDLVGKTVKSVSLQSDCVILVFTDETFVFIKAVSYTGEVDMFFTKHPGDCEMRDAGLITKKEYEEIREAMAEGNKKKIKKRDIAELKRLKKKYEDCEQ